MARTPKITNEEILAAARQVFLEQGFGASTVAIAEKAGISEASIFKRFATKQALFLAAMGISETPQWVKVLATQTPTAAIKSELIEICEQMLAFYQDVIPRVMMMMAQGNTMMPPQVVPPPVRDSQLLAGFLDRAIAAGQIRDCDSMTIALMITGSINSYAIVSNVMNKLPVPIPFGKRPMPEPSSFIDQLIETVWMAIAPVA